MNTMFSGFEKAVTELLGELPARSRTIIKQRYGLGSTKPGMTLEAIGKKANITRERVRQIENDAIARLCKSPSYAGLVQYEDVLVDIIQKHGGIIAEHTLTNHEELSAVEDKKLLVFFLNLSKRIAKRKGNDAFHHRWHVESAPVEHVEKALSQLSQKLQKTKETLAEGDFYRALTEYLTGEEVMKVQPALASYASLTKHIENNKWGEFGHIDSPFIKPRGMRESAFVALSRAGEALHFREIADHISNFLGRKVHVQTVHNELIKDDRFVLVGRGLYALREWGYEPGFVKDVLTKLIRDRGPMTKEQILKEISEVRKVKPSTVSINLQNKKLFKIQDNGTYTLV